LSVKQHEAFSFDSFQDRLLFFDDFEGDQVKDEWAVNQWNGTATVQDLQTGGVVKLQNTVATTNRYCSIDWNDIRSLLISKKVSMEVRAKGFQMANIQLQIYLWERSVCKRCVPTV